MDQEAEILILRPTRVFLSFLASQLPACYLPTGDQVQKDNTAYIIKKKTSTEETLIDIERYYQHLFRHEISRWLGKDARNEVEKNYFDFLCCFKLEWHAHYILLEDSLSEARSMLQLRPRIKLLHWLHTTSAFKHYSERGGEKITLKHLIENATVLLKNFNELSDIKLFLHVYYMRFFELAMRRMSRNKSLWPKINSFHDFNQYFSIEIHTQLIFCAS
jgi:hypothetical protein